MNIAQIITAKRDGHELEDREIEFLINGYARNEIQDGQMGAFAMAVYFRGMTDREIVSLTRAMLHSGEIMQWPASPPKVDKHSTGGIGDKISIPLAPILADCGMAVPMISGRGLGTTGGTIDKLESIPGFRTNLLLPEIMEVVNRVGCVITAATNEIAPADKRLYALRDVTGTVPSIPLITASILSKKLAEGLDSLVLDVKCGNGAFMKSEADAEKLAKTLVQTAKQLGVKTRALLTDMNRPLGKMIGNAVEIDESVEVLQGGGPADVVELTERFAAELMVMCGLAPTVSAGRERARESIDSGRALKKLIEMVKAQGGNLATDRPRADAVPVLATQDGFVAEINSDRLGLAVIQMGGGRKVVGQSIDHSVGIEMAVDLGAKVKSGELLATVFTHDATREEAIQTVHSSFSIQRNPPAPWKLIGRVIE
ncbi:MAG: thymidine phosphorylase [Pirellulaceae bacterium]